MNFCGLSNLFFVGFMVGFPVSLWTGNDLIGLLAGLIAAGLTGAFFSVSGKEQACAIDDTARDASSIAPLVEAVNASESISPEVSHD